MKETMDALLGADNSEVDHRLLRALLQQVLGAVDGSGSGELANSQHPDFVTAKDASKAGGVGPGKMTDTVESRQMEKHSKGQATILIVEDRELDREMLAELLEHARYQVLQAIDGSQALELTRSAHPDLVISDVLLPKMDGYQLVQELRADPAVSGTSVIFYTALFNEREALDLAREIGVVRILSKPMEPEKILESVAEVLKSKGTQPASSPPAAFEEKHLQLLIDKLIAQVKGLQWSESRLQKKNQILRGINRVFHEALTCETEEELARTALKVAKDLTESKGGLMGKVNQARRLDIAFSDWEGCPRSEATENDLPDNLQHFRCFFKKIIVEGQSLVANNLAGHPGSDSAPPDCPPITAFLGAPLKYIGQTIGLIALGNKEGGFDPADQEALENLTFAIVEALMRKRGEAALKQAREELEWRVEERTAELKLTLEERSRLALIVESSDDAIIGKTLDGIITSWNLGAQNLYGYSHAEIIGRPISILVPPEGQDEVPELLKKIRQKGAVDHYETVRLRKDGERVDVSLTISPIKDTGGQIVGAATIARDITERKRAEEEIRQLNEELEQRVRERTAELQAANKELEAFSYSVSHDLKTPIRAIEGFSRMLMGEHTDKLDAEGLRLLKVITDNTKIMHHLIEDLLGLARLVRQPLKKSVIDLGGMAEQVFVRLKAQARRRKLQLIIKEPPPAYGDHSLLYQVMMNLLANAIKYTRSRETGIIEVGGRADGNENIYYVKDNGIGFDERYGDKIFGAFQRLHGGEEYEGTGIGLAIVQRIIQRHGGRVWAEGKVDAGATFYFALPKNGG